MTQFKRIVILVLGIVVLALVATHLYVFELGGLELMAADRIDSALGENSKYSITFGEIGGNLFSGIVVQGVTVRYADSGLAFSVFKADRVTAQYSLGDLLDADYSLSSLHLENPFFVLFRDSTGVIAPRLPGEGKDIRDSVANPDMPSESTAEAPSIAISDLQITGGRGLIVGPADDTLLFEDVHLSGSLASNDGSLAAEIDHFGYESSNENYRLSDLSGRVTYARGNVVFEGFTVSRDKVRAKLSGSYNIKQGTGALDLNADNLNLEEISALTGGRLRGLIDVNARVNISPDEITGRISLGGQFLFAEMDNVYAELRLVGRQLYLDTLYGTILNGCGVDGAGDIDFSTRPETYRLEAEIRNFDLSELVKGSFTSDLSGRLSMDGESFSNTTLLLRLGVDLFESTFDEYPLQMARGPVYVTTDSLWFPEPLIVDYFENRFSTTGTIIYKGDMALDIDADLANLDRYKGKLFIDQPGGRGISKATLSGLTSDPDLSGWFASDSLWVYGLYADSAHATFDIKRFLTGRQGDVEVSLKDGAAWDVPYDSGYALVKLDSQLVFMDSIGFQSEYAGLASRARLDQGTYPWQLEIDSLSLSVLEREFYNRSHLIVEIDSLGFNLKSTAIGKDAKVLLADRRINFDESMNITVAAEGIELGDWLQLFQQELDLRGVLSGKADISGSMASPKFTVNGTLDSIFFRDVFMGTLSGQARYADQRMDIDSLMVKSKSGTYLANGFLHADLAFGDIVTERFPDLPLDLRIRAHDTDFDLVYLLLPSVEDLDGELFADFRIDGTLSEPHLDGQAYIRNGSLKYFDLMNRIRTDSATAIMRDSLIIIEGIRAYVENDKKNSDGYADLSGVLTVRSLDTLHYDLNINIPENIPFDYDLDDIKGTVRTKNGGLKIFGDTPPRVSGDLVLEECRYRVEFADDVTGSPLMLALSGENTWDLNLNIEIPSNYWIKNEDIDAEFGGYLNIIRENGKYRFIGELEIRRGKGYLFDKTFRFVPDSARVIFEDIEYFNPRLDLWATSRIPVSRSGDEERSYQDLKVHVTGTLESPEYAFYEEGSEVALSYEAIVPLIVANYYGDETGGSAFEARISSLISSQVSQIGTRRLGVETFEIDPTYEGNFNLGQTRVTVGTYATTNFYLWGRSDVGFGSRPEYGFEYRLSRELMLEGFRDETEVEGESYHLNLKLHLEW